MKIIYYTLSSVDSTNDWIKRFVGPIEKDSLLLVRADAQTKGKGRRGNLWHSPAGKNLYLSLGLDLSQACLPQLSSVGQIASLAAMLAIEELYGITLGIKWPNDLLHDGKKVGGILVETVVGEDSIRLIVGIGINVHSTKEELSQVGLQALSLTDISGRTIAIDMLVQAIERQFTLLWEKGFDPLLDLYRSSLIHKAGDTIAFRHESRRIEGVFLEITEKGLLRLLESDGEVSEWVAGEILVC